MTTLAALLTELESAVRGGDRSRALELARQIQQQLVLAEQENQALERQVRELLAQLDRPAPQVTPYRAETFHTTRGSMARDSDGEVYPVWFGTNRKPNAMATGFTGQRHDRVTRGRVDVFVPEAHRFGETGSSFWQKLRRWDLRCCLSQHSVVLSASFRALDGTSAAPATSEPRAVGASVRFRVFVALDRRFFVAAPIHQHAVPSADAGVARNCLASVADFRRRLTSLT